MAVNQVRPEDIPSASDALSLSSCRYRGLPLVLDKFSGATTIGLYQRPQRLYSLNTSFKVYETSMKSAFRPDLISLVAYQDWRWWWVILEANNLSGIDKILPGMTLVIPDLDSVQISIEMDLSLNDDVFA